MKANSRTKRALALLLLLLALPPGTAAQEEDDDEGKLGQIYAEVGVWISQAAGLEYEPATVSNTVDPFDTLIVSTEHGTETRFRYRGGYELRSNLGALIFTWYSHEEEVDQGEVRPGQYVFGEIMAHPLFAGFNNDGLADGYQADARTVLRDFRLDFYRVAFSSPRVIGKWFAGYRRIQHKRFFDVDYFAVLNDLPALIPPLTDPRPDLIPIPDSVSTSSSFEGRGIEAGMDFLVPVLRNDVMLEAGFLLAVLRGDLDTQYRSTTSLYVLSLPNEQPEILGPPYLEFTQSVDFIDQLVNPIGLRSENRSTSSDVIDAYFGFRWKAWRDLEVFGGFRSTRYGDVAADLRPRNVVVLGGVNLEDVQEVDRSVTYEGFYGGVSYRF